MDSVSSPQRRNDRTEPLRRRRDALPRVRRCTSRRFFLLLLRTRSCAIGAEALSHQLLLFLSLHLLWTCCAGSRGSASLPVTTASATQIGKPKASSPRC